jgi:DNA topoisomerase-1
MAVFGEPAVRQVIKATLDINGHIFFLRGRQILEKGWLRFYEPYAGYEEAILPKLLEGQTITVQKVVLEERFTKPPGRYNPSSLLRKMEKTEIGTKATRADTIQTLYNRKYVKDERLAVTDLGFGVMEVLEKFCPTVVSIKLTRQFEEEMNRIQTQDEKREDVLSEAVENLKPVVARIKENEEAIGKQLAEAVRKARAEESTIGVCPNCENGKLIILRSRKTGKRFIGCTNYFSNLCKTSFPLPQTGAIRTLARSCRICGLPVVQIRMKGRRSWNLCVNPQCPSKEKRK